ncbi:MAG: sensor histidine kinase [Rhodobacterales bacterium]|nr:sensor histidine kinase [Rhodobacterales bacterium]
MTRSPDAPADDLAPAPDRGPEPEEAPGLSWRVRLAVAVLVVLSVVTVLATHRWLTDRFTETTRNRAELRLSLYSGNVSSELQRNSVVPLLLSRDPELISALDARVYTQTSARLITFQQEIGAAAILLLDADGRTVAATQRTRLGTSHRTAAHFIDAQRARETIFTLAPRETAGFEFTYSRAIRAQGRLLGVIVVEVDLAKYERAWAGIQDAVAVTDAAGVVLLSTVPRWRGLPLDEALKQRDAPSAVERALQAANEFTQNRPDAYVGGRAVMQTQARVPFRGWRIVAFTAYDSVRDRVNSVIALEIMGFAILQALTFYVMSRRAWSRTAFFQRESAELRVLNARLQREIAEREKVQKTLEVAEQTLAQSSKLAVLGEMSAAVSHELNQPLAAMKTYLAGARLLLQRRRPDEALASFQRIDDLIDRMGAITRQLKSYARKGGEAFEPVDLRASISAALAMMEPQLKTRKVRIARQLPRRPVTVMADRIRLEQVIINLLRNAIDATRDAAEPQIDILLSAGETALITVRDNGHGIADLENLFEPFYTTKKPGEGVGLGLAISSGIVTDLGGRLTARNGEGGGAVFEVQLPLLGKDVQAAE